MKMILLLFSSAVGEIAQIENKGYLIGGIIALLIMIYLVYSLFRPEKF
jgi:K+-transporting ATPase KdpF subunit